MKKFISFMLSAAMTLALFVVPVASADGDLIKVGNNTYSTLEDAILNADPNSTIELLGNVTGVKNLRVDKSLIFELNGYTISGSDTDDTEWVILLDNKNVSLTIQNGTVEGTSHKAGTNVIRASQGGELTLTNVEVRIPEPSDGSDYIYGVRVAAVNHESSNYSPVKCTINGNTRIVEVDDPTIDNATNYGTIGVVVLGDATSRDEYSATLIMNGGYINTRCFAISGNGTTDNTYIELNGGEIISTSAVAIYHPQVGDLTVNGNTEITGVGGIQFCGAGKLTVNGGVITSTAPYTPFPSKPVDQGDGSAEDGAAISIISRGGGYQDAGQKIEVEITGGQLISENNAPVSVYRLQRINNQWQSNENTTISSYLENLTISGGTLISNGTEKGALEIDEASNDQIVVTGGTFSSDVSDYIVSGNKIIENTDGTYSIEMDETVAVVKIGNVGYSSLQTAINNAKNNDTVVLLKNINEDAVVPADLTLTLDLNGKTLTNVSSDTITVEKGASLTVTGEGTVDNKSNGRAAIFNNGTVVLNGGTFDRTSETGESADISGGNSWYTICNHGIMTINDGVTVKNTGSFSSMIENGYYSYNDSNTRNGHNPSVNEANPTLTINGGEFIGGLNTVKNDDGGILNIKDGNFTNTTQAAVLNWNVATIDGGYFETDALNCILNGAYTTASSTNDLGELTINGGTFISNGVTVLNYFADDELVDITGGTYLANGKPDESVNKFIPTNTNLIVNPDTGEVGVFYTVTYVVDNDEEAVLVKENGMATDKEAPVKEGLTFIGWYNGDKEYDFNTPVTANLTLTAKYEVTKYTVSFSDGIESQSVEHGKTVIKPADPVKEGYTFVGWYNGDEEYDFNTPVTANLTLTAKFEKNEAPVEPEKPTDEDKPNEPEKPADSNNDSDATTDTNKPSETPNTNGMSLVYCYGLMLILSAMILLVLAKKRSLSK